MKHFSGYSKNERIWVEANGQIKMTQPSDGDKMETENDSQQFVLANKFNDSRKLLACKEYTMLLCVLCVRVHICSWTWTIKWMCSSLQLEGVFGSVYAYASTWIRAIINEN